MAKLRKLSPGATLGFVAASSPVPDPDMVIRGAELAKKWGYNVKIGPSCAAGHGYLAGGDDLRARDLNQMMADPQVDGVVCIRGGYGAPRILDRLDYDMIARGRKPLLGYSDVTALHLALQKMCSLPSLHVPMPTTEWIKSGFEGFTRDSFRALLSGDSLGVSLKNPPGAPPIQGLKGGACQGVLVGGNLSLVCALAGTPYMPDLKGKILFLEDVDEYLHRVDRMLTHLRLTGAFSRAEGIVLGAFTDCTPQRENTCLTLDQILEECVVPYARGPVISGLMAGHCDEKVSLALGVHHHLDGSRASLTMLESPFGD